MAIVIKGDKIRLRNRPEATETLTVDTSATPARMTLVAERGGRQEVMRAVFELAGDTLRTAQHPDGGEFPAGLASPKGSKVIVDTLERTR